MGQAIFSDYHGIRNYNRTWKGFRALLKQQGINPLIRVATFRRFIEDKILTMDQICNAFFWFNKKFDMDCEVTIFTWGEDEKYR